jgi:hypothetical protein
MGKKENIQVNERAVKKVGEDEWAKLSKPQQLQLKDKLQVEDEQSLQDQVGLTKDEIDNLPWSEKLKLLWSIEDDVEYGMEPAWREELDDWIEREVIYKAMKEDGF